MILVTQQEYDTTLALMRGQVKLPPVFEELQAFMRQKYGLVAVNFVLDKLSHYTPPRPRLRVFAQGGRGALAPFYSGANYDAQKQKEIGDKFVQLNEFYGNFAKDDTDFPLVIFTDFDEEIENVMAKKAAARAKPYLLKQYAQANIWRIDQVFASLFVFYQTRHNTLCCETDGTSEGIRRDWTQFMLEHDEFGLLEGKSASVVFDSKETVDTSFEGKLFYYYR